MPSNRLRKCDRCGQPVPEGGLGIRDFAFLDGTAPRGITVSNIDGIFHDRYARRFLVFETKREGEPELASGQRELLGALSEVPGFTVLVLRELPSGDIQSVDMKTWDVAETPAVEISRWVAAWWREFAEAAV